MFKKIVFLFVLLLLIAAVVPFFIGQLTKTQLASAITVAQIDNPLLKVKVVEHTNGWLNSKLQYRITELADDSITPRYEMDIQATLSHGLVFWHTGGVGLAQLTGDVVYRHPNLTEAVDIPARVVIGLFGQGSARFELTSDQNTKTEKQLAIEPTLLILRFSVSGSRLDLELQTDGLSLTPAWTMARSELTGKFNRSPQQLWLGKLQVRLGELSIGNEALGASDLELSITEQSAKVNYQLTGSIEKPATQGFAYGPGVLDLRITDLDAESLAQLLAIHIRIQEHESPEFARQTLMPQIMQTLPRLLVHGPTTTVDYLELASQAGTLSGNLSLRIPAMEGVGLAGLILAEGNTRLEIPLALGRHWETGSLFSPLWQTLRHQGLLETKHDQHRLDGIYKDKKLTINNTQYKLPF